MKYSYLGITTRRIYEFEVAQSVNPLSFIQINGEDALLVNNDGSIARGVAGPSPDGYSPGAVFSPWEQHQ